MSADPRCICTPDQYQGNGHGVNCPSRTVSAPETAAGKLIRSLTEIWWKAGGVTTPDQHRMVAQVRAIEAEARAALRAELRAAVEGLPKRYAPAVMNSALGDEAMVDRAVVLRLIAGDA